MTEIDALIAGAVGGSLAGIVMCLALLGQIRFAYEEKFRTLQYQIIALRVELNKEFVE